MKTLIIAVLLSVFVAGPIAKAAAWAQESATAAAQAEHRRLFRKGAKLWPLYCNTCHNARPGSEKAPYEWDQIIMHMRTLGNLPADDTRALVEYLKSR
ncbi:MAG TPA: hypothetical protein VEC38_09190 [Candidatus Binataceae bacterium]|nr:hypothetical protein [Candidatus Binataceae bacterium]